MGNETAIETLLGQAGKWASRDGEISIWQGQLIGFARRRIFTAVEDNATASGRPRLDASSRLSCFRV